MLSNPNAFMFTLQIKFSVDLGQRRLGKTWFMVHFFSLLAFTGCSDQGCPHFLRNIHAPRTSQIIFTWRQRKRRCSIFSSFSITTDSGELHGQDKERLDSSKVCACFPSIVFWSNEYRGSCLLWHFRCRLFSLLWMALGGRYMSTFFQIIPIRQVAFSFHHWQTSDISLVPVSIQTWV